MSIKKIWEKTIFHKRKVEREEREALEKEILEENREVLKQKLRDQIIEDKVNKLSGKKQKGESKGEKMMDFLDKLAKGMGTDKKGTDNKMDKILGKTTEKTSNNQNSFGSKQDTEEKIKRMLGK